MANPFERELTTKDDIPLSSLMADAYAELELFNEAERPFRQMLAQDVNERTFRVHVGDMTWEELAEGEHARTGALSSTQMAFSVKKFGRSLGWTQEFVEDNSSDMVLRQVRKLLEGALNKEHEVIFDTLKNGVADGSQLWFDPEPFGAYTFSNTHDHTFADSQELFGDANAHSMTAHIREANKELRHHGKTPTVALMSSDLAANFVDELAYEANYLIPEAEGMVSGSVENTLPPVDGVRIYQTAWLTGDQFYVIAGNEMPIYFHTARPVQFTQGSEGGPVGDPAAMIGAYGSARYGTVMADPLAAVDVTVDNIA